MSRYQSTDYLSKYGQITGYGSKYWTPGLDVDLKIGDEVTAPKDGEITFVGDRGGFGNQVRIIDERGIESWLSHLDSTDVVLGDRVTAGQRVGAGGNTGKTYSPAGGDGSHLDLTVVKNGEYLSAEDAEKYVSYNPIVSIVDAKDLNNKIDQARSLGKTDTEILDYFSSKDSDVKNMIEADRKLYGQGGEVNNDRDLLNFLSRRASGSDPMIESVAEPKEEPGFIESVEERIGERVETIEEKSDMQARGEISTPTQIVNFASQAIGALGDIAFEGVKAVTPDSAKKAIGDFVQSIAEADPGEKIGIKQALNANLQAIGMTMNSYNNFAEKHPEIATNLESVVNISEIVPVERALGLGVKGTKKALTAAEEAAKQAKKIELPSAAPLKKGAEVAVEKAGEVTKFGIGEATGLPPKAITRLINEPGKYTDEILRSVDKESFGKSVFDKIAARKKALSATGKGYDDIRKLTDSVEIDHSILDDILDKYKIGYDGKKITRTKATKLPLREGDVKAIEEFGKLFGKETNLTADEFLNARAMLSDMAKYDATKSDAASIISKELRKAYDKMGKDQLPGLKKLDETYASEKTILSKVRKDYFNVRTGELKDGAINKLANIGNKEPVIKRLEALIPDIRQQLNVLEMVKDIEYASGRAVGRYTRSILGAGGVISMNVPMMVSSIVATPKLAVPLLRKYGKAKLVSKKLISSTAKALENGIKLTKQQVDLMKRFFATAMNDVKRWVKELKGNQAGFQKLPGKKTKTIKINDIELNSYDFKEALKDVKEGRLSKTDLPVLLGKDKSGKYFVKDGNHRIAQAKKRGDKEIGYTTNEKKYRELEEKFESKKKPALKMKKQK